MANNAKVAHVALTLSEAQLLYTEMNASIECGAEDPDYKVIRARAAKCLRSLQKGSQQAAGARNFVQVVRRPLLVSGMLTTDDAILIDSEQSKQQQHNALWHELVHRILIELGMDEHDEVAVEQVALLMARSFPTLAEARSHSPVDTIESAPLTDGGPLGKPAARPKARQHG